MPFAHHVADDRSHKRKGLAFLALALCIGNNLPAVKADSAIIFPEGNIVPFIQENCARCHGPEKQKGKLRLDTLPLEINNDSTAQRWQDVLDALNAGDMPPEDEKQPGKKKLTQVLADLTDDLKLGQSIILPEEDTPLGNLWVTLLRQAGVQVDSLGSSTGILPELIA